MVDTPIHALAVDEAWELLATAEMGRIAVSVGGQPDIFPINFYAGQGRILFRTAEGTKLSELTVNDHVAFETDSYTDTGGWSVVVKGTARVLSTGAEIADADKQPLKPWVPTLKYNYVEITPTEVSARRFDFGPEPERYPV